MKKHPFLQRLTKTGPELPLEPPLLLSDRSNGEIFHRQTPREKGIRRLVLSKADEMASRYGMDRREFLASSMGMVVTLSAINTVGCSDSGGPAGPAGSSNGGVGPNPDGGAMSPAPLPPGHNGGSVMPGGSGGTTGAGGAGGTGGAGSGGASGGDSGGVSADAGGVYNTGDSGATSRPDPAECDRVIDTSAEFIFDIQTHHVERAGGDYQVFLSLLPQGACGLGAVECLNRDDYIRLMFLESDTTVSVLSGVPALEPSNPLRNEEIAASRDAVNMLAASQRTVNHHMVLPNNGLEAELDKMQAAVENYGVAGWKCYTPWGPENSIVSTPGGYRLDDPAVGLPFIEKGRALGVKTFCCHKGLPLPTFNPNMAMPDDIGEVAQMFPDCHFIVYHSAYQAGGSSVEGPYQEGSMSGIDSLITAMRSRGIGPSSNVYAELGTTWYEIMNDPTQAAHVLGKLLLHVGEDNIVWGSDSIWYGSPQPIIEAFLRFEITPQFQQMYGYPALTMERKRKILGLNAARLFGVDPLQTRCAITSGDLATTKQYLDHELGRRRWAFWNRPLGPTTRRDFLGFQRWMRFLNLPG